MKQIELYDFRKGKNSKHKIATAKKFLELIENISHGNYDDSLDDFSELKEFLNKRPEGGRSVGELFTSIGRHILNNWVYPSPHSGDFTEQENIETLNYIKESFELIEGCLEIESYSDGPDVEFLEDRAVPLEKCSSENAYYKQPTGADICGDLLKIIKDRVDLALEMNKAYEFFTKEKGCSGDIENEIANIYNNYWNNPYVYGEHYKFSPESAFKRLEAATLIYGKDTFKSTAGNRLYPREVKKYPVISWDISFNDLNNVFGLYNPSFTDEDVLMRVEAAKYGYTKEEVSNFVYFDRENPWNKDRQVIFGKKALTEKQFVNFVKSAAEAVPFVHFNAYSKYDLSDKQINIMVEAVTAYSQSKSDDVITPYFESFNDNYKDIYKEYQKYAFPEHEMPTENVIAQIKWVPEDVENKFEEYFGRKPEKDELDKLLTQLDTDLMEDNGISAGWDVVDEFMMNEGKEIVRESGHFKPLDYAVFEDVENFKKFINVYLPSANLSTEEVAFFLKHGANIDDRPDQLAIFDGELYCHVLEGNSDDPQNDYPVEFNVRFDKEQDVRGLFTRCADLLENDLDDLSDRQKYIVNKFRDIGADDSSRIHLYEKYIKDGFCSFDDIVRIEPEVIEANPDMSPEDVAKEVAWRTLRDTLDLHGFDSSNEDKLWNYNSEILEEQDIILSKLVDKYTSGSISSDTIQKEFEIALNTSKTYNNLKSKGLMEPFGTESLHLYSFSPFGYEGSLVTVETDIRNGIPAYDIVGIADSAVAEARGRVISAVKNSGLEFPANRCLQSLSPADLRKEGGGFDLPMALGVLFAKKNVGISEPVLAMGELELSGEIRPVKGFRAAVTTAVASGITHFIASKANVKEVSDIPGIHIMPVENLKEAVKGLELGSFDVTKPELDKNLQFLKNNKDVYFNTIWTDQMKSSGKLDFLKGGYSDAVEATLIAAAGKHNLHFVGAPGCGKEMIIYSLLPALTPLLTYDEMQSKERIYSLAGLSKGKADPVAPFRCPHQSASIEGICGGGPNCRPGEISLAHNGTLFLDEAAEFRSSVLQMLRVPIETKSITLSRAGRSTVYPADFQLAMATNPCPCGNCGSSSKICLCSSKSIDQYWKKFSSPLLDRVGIRCRVEVDPNDTKSYTIEELQNKVSAAFKIQRERGVYNNDLSPQEILDYAYLDQDSRKVLDSYTLREQATPRDISNVLKIALTCANLDGRTEIKLNDLNKAIHFHPSVEQLYMNEIRKLPSPEKEKDKSQGFEGR